MNIEFYDKDTKEPVSGNSYTLLAVTSEGYVVCVNYEYDTNDGTTYPLSVVDVKHLDWRAVEVFK